MSYRLRATINLDWVGDGAGPGFGFVSLAQTKGFQLTTQGGIIVPGYTFANPPTTPTLANFYTALTGSSATPSSNCVALDIGTQINVALAQIQNFQIGGG